MGRYAGRIKVVGNDYMCFPVDLFTLEALAQSCYDPYAWVDPDPEPTETICLAEWSQRRQAIFQQQMRQRRDMIHLACEFKLDSRKLDLLQE